MDVLRGGKDEGLCGASRRKGGGGHADVHAFLLKIRTHHMTASARCSEVSVSGIDRLLSARLELCLCQEIRKYVGRPSCTNKDKADGGICLIFSG